MGRLAASAPAGSNRAGAGSREHDTRVMRRRTVLWIGLIGALVLWGAAWAYSIRPIERSIEVSIASELNRRGLLRKIESLALKISGRDLTLAGTALSPDDREAALAIARAAPGVARVTDAIRLAPEEKPFVFRATRTPDGRVTLSGAVASPEARDRLIEFGRSVFGRELSVALHLARGAPQHEWFEAARLAIEVVALVEQGEAVLSDRTLTVTGRAADDATLDAVQAALMRSMPRDYTEVVRLLTAVDQQLTGGQVTEVKDCQTLVDRVVGGRAFHFEPASAALRDVPPRLLDRLAQVMRRCTGLYLQIYAASDAHIGDPAANLRLSEARAQTLLESLAKRGVARERLAALGRGRVDPRDRAKTPDVEFHVSESAEPVVRPFVWQVQKNPDGRGVISGHQPNAEAKAALAEAARAALGAKFEDESRLAHGAPPGDWVGAARLAIDAVARLESGVVRLVDYDLVVTGVARDDPAVEALKSFVGERMPKDYRAKFELVAALDEQLKGAVLTQPERCQALFDAVARTGAVEFVVDGPELLDRQRALFQRLVAAHKRCPDMVLEIGGHSTGSGDREAARVLSESWAQAVADALVAAGDARRTLKPVGYGNTLPVADGATEAGRLRNRRIVFRIVPQ
jgi:outer membrane protein OmpA-like peptidoglycan-associated protein